MRRAGTELRALATLLTAAALSGCMFSGGSHAPTWVVLRGARSAQPPQAPIARVLVLPFQSGDAVPGHAEAMRAAFAQALRESCGWEVLAPELAELPRSTRNDLQGGAAREHGALIRMHREWGADAVLYGRLASSRPYGDPAVGVELLLVDARDAATLWSAQDVVDSRETEVRAALDAFLRAVSGDPVAPTAPPSQLPADAFARFVARSFVRTLFSATPSPAKPAKSGIAAQVAAGSSE